VAGTCTSNSKSGSSISNKDPSYNFAKPAPTYWSAAAAQATATSPDHVRAANTPAPPIPEEAVDDIQGDVIDAPETAASHGDESVLEKAAHKVTEFAGETKDEIEDFLQKLFEEDGIENDKAKEEAVPPPKELTEEEKEEQKRLKEQETKEKRADITGRHTKWEEKLEKAGQAEVDEMLEKIRKLRQEVVEGMRTKPEMFDLLKKMQEDGFKHMENTDKYLLKLGDNKANGPEGQKMWEKVLERVQKKLDDRTIEVSTFLQNWFRDVMQKEKALVR
jgi:Zn-dependent M32 family carboxypeptidase